MIRKMYVRIDGEYSPRRPLRVRRRNDTQVQ